MECTHLIKYDGKNVELSGLSFQGFQLGKLAVEPKLLQAVGHTLMLLDASQYYFCQSVKNAPDEETRRRYYDILMQERVRAQDIMAGLAALTINPESKQIEEALIKMLFQNHNRALQIEQDQRIEVPQEEVKADSPNTIEIGKGSLKDKLGEVQQLYLDSPKVDEFQNLKRKTTSQIDYSGLLDLLTEKFSMEEIKTLCFEYGVEYDNLGGEGKQAKARELILYLKHRDKLGNFYEFLTTYLATRG